MNRTDLRPYAPAELEAFEARLAFRMAARLTEHAAELPQDVTERLRFAREQALERGRAARKSPVSETATVVQGNATLAAGPREGGSSWWVQIAALLPLIALLGGLVMIQRLHNNSQISAAAEIDASLLADDLPPDAYSDPGFVEFLKTPRD